MKPIRVRILPTEIWVESGVFGERVVVVQHEGMDPFDYAVFNYRYGYTDNNSTHREAMEMALKLGAVEPVEFRARALPKEFRKPPPPAMPVKDEG